MCFFLECLGEITFLAINCPSIKDPFWEGEFFFLCRSMFLLIYLVPDRLGKPSCKAPSGPTSSHGVLETVF